MLKKGILAGATALALITGSALSASAATDTVDTTTQIATTNLASAIGLDMGILSLELTEQIALAAESGVISEETLLTIANAPEETDIVDLVESVIDDNSANWEAEEDIWLETEATVATNSGCAAADLNCEKSNGAAIAVLATQRILAELQKKIDAALALPESEQKEALADLSEEVSEMSERLKYANGLKAVARSNERIAELLDDEDDEDSSDEDSLEEARKKIEEYDDDADENEDSDERDNKESSSSKYTNGQEDEDEKDSNSRVDEDEDEKDEDLDDTRIGRGDSSGSRVDDLSNSDEDSDDRSNSSAGEEDSEQDDDEEYNTDGDN